jgi:hypothetical protein
MRVSAIVRAAPAGGSTPEIKYCFIAGKQDSERELEKAIRDVSHLGQAMTSSSYTSNGQHEDPVSRLGQHPVVGDPRFMDPEAGDFRLSPGSPALGLGAHSG